MANEIEVFDGKQKKVKTITIADDTEFCKILAMQELARAMNDVARAMNK